VKKRILVISDGIVHPSIMARRNFKNFLRGMDGLECVYSSSIEALRTLSDGAFGAVAVYLHRRAISDEALRALEDFVRGGGGFLAVHSASAPFKDARPLVRGARRALHRPRNNRALHPAACEGCNFSGRKTSPCTTSSICTVRRLHTVISSPIWRRARNRRCGPARMEGPGLLYARDTAPPP
jgi:hypothetical protein